MSREVTDILKEALELPSEARSALIGSLLESLDSEVDEGAEEIWHAAISRRIKELDSGKVTPTPWSEVRSRLRAAVANGR